METRLKKLEEMFENFEKEMNELKLAVEILNHEIAIIDKLIGDLYAKL